MTSVVDAPLNPNKQQKTTNDAVCPSLTLRHVLPPLPPPPSSAKLREFNQRTGDGSHRLEESVLQELTKLAEPEGTPAPHHLATLLRMLDWPKGRTWQTAGRTKRWYCETGPMVEVFQLPEI